MQDSTDEREKLLDRLLRLPLDDAVLEICLWNAHRRQFGPPPHSEKIESRMLDARYAPSRIEDAGQRVNALLRAAIIIGAHSTITSPTTSDGKPNCPGRIRASPRQHTCARSTMVST